MTGLPRIVHVSADFPDPIEPEKTPVIRSLLELTREQFAHHVISLNRRAPGLADMLGRRGAEAQAFAWGEARVYRAPPLGILHRTMLHRLGARLAEGLRADPPDLLVGHKLTIEGLAVAEAARRLQVPYAITIQGNSDGKILAARPDLARALGRVFHGAAAVFAFAPWALAEVEARLGLRSGMSMLVPCPTDLDSVVAPVSTGMALLSAFHLRHAKNKNLAGMAAALRMLHGRGEGVPFAVASGGSVADHARCEAILAGIPDASLAGPLGREALQAAMNRAIGFVLPSHRESFGLVFVEALFAGLPVVYSEGRAIAGWFDDLPFAIPVNPNDPAAIASAMQHLVREEAQLKQALARWQQSAQAARFTRPRIAATFTAGLHQALAPSDPPLQKEPG